MWLEGAADVAQPIWVINRGGDVAWPLISTSMTLGYVTGSLVAVRVRTRWLVSGSMALGAGVVGGLVARRVDRVAMARDLALECDG